VTCTSSIGYIPESWKSSFSFSISHSLFSSFLLSLGLPSSSLISPSFFLAGGNPFFRQYFRPSNPAPPPIQLHHSNSINLFQFGAVACLYDSLRLQFYTLCFLTDFMCLTFFFVAAILEQRKDGKSNRCLTKEYFFDEESLRIRSVSRYFSKINDLFPTCVCCFYSLSFLLITPLK